MGRLICGFWNFGIDIMYCVRLVGFRDFSGGGDSVVVVVGSGSGLIMILGKIGFEDLNVGWLNVCVVNVGCVWLVGGCV